MAPCEGEEPPAGRNPKQVTASFSVVHRCKYRGLPTEARTAGGRDLCGKASRLLVRPVYHAVLEALMCFFGLFEIRPKPSAAVAEVVFLTPKRLFLKVSLEADAV